MNRNICIIFLSDKLVKTTGSFANVKTLFDINVSVPKNVTSEIKNDSQIKQP